MEEEKNVEQPKKRGRKKAEVKPNPKKRGRKKAEVKPNPKKVWVYFTIKSARGKDKVCLPYALAKKLEKSGNVKIIGE